MGSITGIIDSSGNLVQTYRYDSFGNILNQTGTLEQPFTFTGREFDEETGLYYYRARYYDPRIGRFLQQDPIWNNNLYSYCGNNPLNLIDPYGLVGMYRGEASLTAITSSNRRIHATVGSVTEFRSFLSNIRNSGEKIAFFEYVGHGFEEGMGLSIGNGGILVENGSSGDLIGIEELGDELKSSFDCNATIELEGCFTAYGNNSIASGVEGILAPSHTQIHPLAINILASSPSSSFCVAQGKAISHLTSHGFLPS